MAIRESAQAPCEVWWVDGFSPRHDCVPEMIFPRKSARKTNGIRERSRCPRVTPSQQLSLAWLGPRHEIVTFREAPLRFVLERTAHQLLAVRLWKLV